MEDVIIENTESKKRKIGVYVKYDSEGKIIDVNSDIFLESYEGWTKIDEGYGDKYAHAQSQYFENRENFDEEKQLI